jgi:hypothetical protein
VFLHAPRIALAALLLLAGAIYLPGLPGSFVLDDLHNITLNPHLAIERPDPASLNSAFFAGSPASPWPSRGLAHLSFALNFLASGGRFDPAAVKATNIAIHLVNGALVYLLVCAILRARAGADRPGAGARWVAVIASGLWLLHPLQLTSVLYAVQRMNSLSALFSLLGLVLYCAGRRRLARHPGAGLMLMTVGVLGGTGLGALSKENAVLTPLFALLLELWFFSLPGRCEAHERRRVALFHGAVILLPGAAALALLASHWERVMAQYAFRDFDLLERLMTQARVLLHYLRWFVLPRTRDLGLFHDDIPVSTGLLSPWTTAPALLLWAGVLIACAATFRSRPILGFCALWFLGGHLVESTVIPLEMVFEHRNYLPVLGPCVALAWLIVSAVRRGALAPRGAVAITTAVMLLLGFATTTRAGIWRDDYTLSYFLARNHPGSYRANTELARVLVQRGGDARAIHAALARAATDETQPVLALLEMVKLTVEREERIERGALPELEAPPPDPLALDAPLHPHRGYLQRLRALLVEVLEERLSTQPLSYETARALEMLRTCVVERRLACAPLREQCERWHRLAMANPRHVPATRATVEYSFAVLLADAGRNDEAAELAGRAWRRVPGELGIGFYQALYLLRAGRFEEASRIVAHMEDFHRRTGRRGDEVRRLRDVFDETLREAGESG